MSVTLGTDEAEAVRVFSIAQMDQRDPVNLYELTHRLMGYTPKTGAEADELRRMPDGWRIHIQANRPERMRWMAAVLLARWWIAKGARQVNERALASAILAPLGQWMDVMADVGSDVPELAEAFGVSQSFALLRIGEAKAKFAAIRRHDGLIIFSGRGAGVRTLNLQHIKIDDEPFPRVGLLCA